MSAARRRGRRGVAIHGVLPVDKPSGPTSNEVVRALQRRLHPTRIGHAGTLDPLASGLLLICLGEGTKAVPWLMDAAKSYHAELRLGVETDTLDAAGEVIRQSPVAPVERSAVERLLKNRFVGTLQQVPPIYSALHQNGERLYAKARRGEEVVVAPREVVSHAITLRSLDHDTLSLDVTCGKGFYVRSLARDIGHALGCGAHLTSLRRSSSAGFSLDQARTLDELLAPESDWRSALVPVPEALAHLPAVCLDEEESERLANGQIVPLPTRADDEPAPRDGPVRAFASTGQMIAVAALETTDAPRLRVLRGFLLQPSEADERLT